MSLITGLAVRGSKSTTYNPIHGRILNKVEAQRIAALLGMHPGVDSMIHLQIKHSGYTIVVDTLDKHHVRVYEQFHVEELPRHVEFFHSVTAFGVAYMPILEPELRKGVSQ